MNQSIPTYVGSAALGCPWERSSHPLRSSHGQECPRPTGILRGGILRHSSWHSSWHVWHVFVALLPLPTCVSLISRGSLCRTKYLLAWIARKRNSIVSLIRVGCRDTSPSSWTATGAGPSGATCAAG